MLAVAWLAQPWVWAAPNSSVFEAGPAHVSTSHPASREIDRLTFERHRALNLQTANLCSDAVFLRRVYLDVIGTLPTGFEAQAFLENRAPDKRRQLVDQLLERDEYVDYWTMKWCDLLRVKAEFPINLWPNAVQAYHRYLHDSVRLNKPGHLFARELLTASGSNFRVGQVNFYRALQSRAPRDIAQTVALTFLGERAGSWPTERLDGLAGFFAQVGYKSTQEWKEEIVYFDPARDTHRLAAAARFPDGSQARLTGNRDPRELFADWLLDPEHPAFARNMANRAWSWLLGRGIIHQPDDIRPDNPPSNPALLEHLRGEWVRSGYDFKHLFRIILNSTTYQLSCIPKTDTPEAAAQFAHYPLRRLEAEVLIDALNQLTGSRESYSSLIPEPFTFIPDDQRAIALPDGSITSSFLELFGRSPRDTGLESERNLQITAGQCLHLLNSTHLQRKLESSPMIRFQTSGNKPPRQIARGLYLGVLSRLPTADELAAVEQTFPTGKTGHREATIDLAWALLNSPEFLYRH
jgi:hypothetical protein